VRAPAALLALLAVLAAAGVRAAPVAVRGATIHPISGPAIPSGVLVTDGERITAVGREGEVEIPEHATIVDAEGLDLWPGLVDAMSHLGLVEIGSVRGTRDHTESGQMNPNSRAEVAINASSPHFPVTRANGILLAASVPYGSLVPGTSAAIALDGWTWEEMVRRAPLSLVVEWPRMEPGGGGAWEDEDEEEVERTDWEERLARLDDMVAEGEAYRFARDDSPELRDADVQWESLRPVVAKEIPVWVRVRNLTEIREALSWAERHDLEMVLVDGSSGVGGDAWRIADELAARRIPVIVQTTRHPARKYEPYDTAFAAPGVLHAHGVSIAFGSWDSAHARDLPQEAARAVAFGLPREAAERALTLGGAEILGVADRYGSLDAGKSATMILVDGDVLEVRMQVVRAWIDGSEIDLENRHTELWKKWSARPGPSVESPRAMR
jgi:imidazolonepropionase-like amidohydrolase